MLLRHNANLLRIVSVYLLFKREELKAKRREAETRSRRRPLQRSLHTQKYRHEGYRLRPRDALTQNTVIFLFKNLHQEYRDYFIITMTIN